MKQVVEYRLADGSSILVETDVPAGGIHAAARADGVVEASQTLEQALDSVKATAQAVVAKVRGMVDRPHECTVTFGIKLGAKAGAIIASTDVEANFQVTIAWKYSAEDATSVA